MDKMMRRAVSARSEVQMRKIATLLVILGTVMSIGVPTVQADLSTGVMQEVGRTVDDNAPEDIPGYDQAGEVLRTIQNKGHVDPGRVGVLWFWFDAEAYVDPCMDEDHVVYASAAYGADPDLGSYPDEPISYEPGDDETSDPRYEMRVAWADPVEPGSGGDDSDDPPHLDDLEPEEGVDELYEGVWGLGGSVWEDVDGVVGSEEGSTEGGPDGVSSNATDPDDRFDPCEGGAPQSENGTRNVTASGIANSYKDAWVDEICGWKGWVGASTGAQVGIVEPEQLPDEPDARQEAPCVFLDRAEIPSAGIGWSLERPDLAAATGLGVRPGEIPDVQPRRTSEPDSLVAGLVYGFGADAGATAAAPGLSPAMKIAVGGLALVGFAVVVLYRRLTKDDVLDNDLRLRMLEIVESDPGTAATGIAETLDVAVTTVLYHGRVLVETGHLVSKRNGRQVAFFATEDAETILERELVCAMKRSGKRDLIELLAEDPGLNLSEAARRLDRNRSTIKRHADDLVETGLVVDDREGRSRTLALDPEARALVASP